MKVSFTPLSDATDASSRAPKGDVGSWQSVSSSGSGRNAGLGLERADAHPADLRPPQFFNGVGVAGTWASWIRGRSLEPLGGLVATARQRANQWRSDWNGVLLTARPRVVGGGVIVGRDAVDSQGLDGGTQPDFERSRQSGGEQSSVDGSGRPGLVFDLGDDGHVEHTFDVAAAESAAGLLHDHSTRGTNRRSDGVAQRQVVGANDEQRAGRAVGQGGGYVVCSGITEGSAIGYDLTLVPFESRCQLAAALCW
jgi:hypothetical protein